MFQQRSPGSELQAALILALQSQAGGCQAWIGLVKGDIAEDEVREVMSGMKKYEELLKFWLHSEGLGELLEGSEQTRT